MFARWRDTFRSGYVDNIARNVRTYLLQGNRLRDVEPVSKGARD